MENAGKNMKHIRRPLENDKARKHAIRNFKAHLPAAGGRTPACWPCSHELNARTGNIRLCMPITISHSPGNHYYIHTALWKCLSRGLSYTLTILFSQSQAKILSLSNSPGIKIPFSVTKAVIRAAGVTSKAGFQTGTVSGAIGCVYHISVTS